MVRIQFIDIYKRVFAAEEYGETKLGHLLILGEEFTFSLQKPPLVMLLSHL